MSIEKQIDDKLSTIGLTFNAVRDFVTLEDAGQQNDAATLSMIYNQIADLLILVVQNEQKAISKNYREAVNAERKLCAKMVRDLSEESKGYAWYHPQIHLRQLADQMERKPDGS